MNTTLFRSLAAVLALAFAGGAMAQAASVAFWPQVWGDGSAAECLTAAVVDPFNAMEEDIDVVSTIQPNWWDATRTSLAGGAGPDVVGTPGPSFMMELARAGLLAPLDDLAIDHAWADTFAAWALDLGRFDGVLYGLPDGVETMLLLYNASLFEQHGWEVPATIDEFVALAATIDAAGIIPFAHTNADWRAANEWFLTAFLNHVAGPDVVYAALTQQRPWTDPALVAAVDVLTDMQQAGWFMGGLDRYYTTPSDEKYAALADGQAAMMIEGSWVLSSMPGYFAESLHGHDWDWAPVPSFDGQSYFAIGLTQTYSVSAHAEHPAAAAAFLDYFFQPEVQARRFTDCGYDPGPVDVALGALEAIDPRHERLFVELDTAFAAGNYGYTTWSFWPARSNQYVWEEIERVWAGHLSAEAYLEGLQSVFDEEARQGAVLTLPER